MGSVGTDVVELGLKAKWGLDRLAVGREHGGRKSGLHTGSGAGIGTRHGNGRRGRNHVHVDRRVVGEVGGGLLDDALEEGNTVAKLHVLLVDVVAHHGKHARLGHGGGSGGDYGLDVLEHVRWRRGDVGQVDTATGADNLGRDAKVRGERNNRVGGRGLACFGGRGWGGAGAQRTVLCLKLYDAGLEPCKVGLALVSGALCGLAVADCLVV